MEQYISKSALVAEIENLLKPVRQRLERDKNDPLDSDIALYEFGEQLIKKINTLKVKECEAKSGIVQKDLQIVLDDGMYIDLDPSMQLKPSFSVKEGERVKVVIFKLGIAVSNKVQKG